MKVRAAGAVVLAVVVGGCASGPRATGTMIGTATGSAAGALVGARVGGGHSGTGALVGAGLGALLGMLVGDQLQRREQETPPAAPASPPAPTGSNPPGAAKPDATPGDPSKGQFSNATTWLVRIYIDPDPDDVEKTRPIQVLPTEKVPWDLDVGQYRIIARAYASTQYGERLVGRYDRTVQIDVRRAGWLLEFGEEDFR
jgi:Glycine zipper